MCYYVIFTAPSIPLRLRAFVTSDRSCRVKPCQQTRVTLRWARPAEPAGLISLYQVSMATSMPAGSWTISSLDANTNGNKYVVTNVVSNSLLQFKVS